MHAGETIVCNGGEERNAGNIRRILEQPLARVSDISSAGRDSRHEPPAASTSDTLGGGSVEQRPGSAAGASEVAAAHRTGSASE